MARLSVGSFNAHYGYDTRVRYFDVAEVCRQIDADLLVVQESWVPDEGQSDVDRVAAEMGYQVIHEPMGPARISGRKPRLVAAERAEGQLMISMLTRLPLVSSQILEMHHLRLDSAPRRFAIRVDAEVEGETFCYVGTHLDHLTHGSPYQLNKLRRLLPGPEHPAALAGDMNMWGPVLVALMPGWRRAVRGRTWPNVFPHSQIDHIVVNRPVGIESWQVLRAGRSDHLPVRAVLRI